MVNGKLFVTLHANSRKRQCKKLKIEKLNIENGRL